MQIFFISSGLLLHLIPSVLTADVDVGSTCATGDTCVDSNAFCDTSDKKCTCHSGWVQNGRVCARGWGRPCDRGMCLDNAVCTDNSLCSCDTSKTFLAGINGTTSCSCDANSVLSQGKCLKKVGQHCSNAADCITTAGMVCADRGGAMKCTCDTSKHYVVGSDGEQTCSCATSHAKKADKSCGLVINQTCTTDASCIDKAKCGNKQCKCDTAMHYGVGSAGDTSCVCDGTKAEAEGDKCLLKVNQPCSSTADCITTDGMVCADRSGSKKCTCDTSKNYAAGANDDTTCSCNTHYAKKADKSCGLVIDQTCTSDASCIDKAKCTEDSGMKCKCDTTKHYAEGIANDTSCSCNTTKAKPSGGKCLLEVGQPCSSADECIATPGMLCAIVSGTKKCTCDTNKKYNAGNSGNTLCTCAADHHIRSDKSCGLVIGQPCTLTGTPCVDNAVCDAKTDKCTCDPAKLFAPGIDGAADCLCNTGIGVAKADGSCGLKVGQKCALKTAATVCGPQASCNTTSFLCSCDGGTSKQNTDGTCQSGAPTTATSFGLLTLAVLAASHLLI